MTADISRHSLRPNQKFTGVVRQQGRLPLDADETEAGDIATLMLRQALVETICTKGSPDDGFSVARVVVTTEGALNFSLMPGSFYLGGVRIATEEMKYAFQPDWQTFVLDAAESDVPSDGTRTDLVWLHAWEQTVTATEDAELFERALGGVDTTARRRVMFRVHVLPDVPDTCQEALTALISREFPKGTLEADGCTVVSNTRLTIDFTQLAPLEDLCRPSAQAGFLGARNESFRIQITAPGRFVWGRDNAAPLYRVQIEAHTDSRRRRIIFLTLPRDEFGWPLAGMTVELLRWGALLDNGEKVAEPTGLLLRVMNGFDPADSSILVSGDVPIAWDEWFTTEAGEEAINSRDDASVNKYFFLRVWTGGGDADVVDYPVVVGTPVELGDTGLTAEFSDIGMQGDYWIVSARPNTPTEVTPWALLAKAPPAGPLRLIAPLALLPWTKSTPGSPLDCRHRFRPLCKVGGCCLVTVGDGRISHGDVTSIQEAVRRLPPEGGEICIYPGDYKEHITITGRRNISITGCGRGTRWRRGETESESSLPLLHIINSSGITVRRLGITGSDADCVRAEYQATEDARPEQPKMEKLLLEDLEFTISDAGGVAAFEVKAVTIRRCQVVLQKMSTKLSDSNIIGRAAAFFLAGTDLTVEHCRIEKIETRSEDSRLDFAVGGIHIGGGSEYVIIRDNIIHGGNGHGITLGSIRFVRHEDGATVVGDADGPTIKLPPGQFFRAYPGIGYFGAGIVVDKKGCIKWSGTPPVDLIPKDTPMIPTSGGLVRDISIVRNDIAQMGYSGISAHVFAGLGREGFADAVAVETIEIAENRITGCMTNEIGEITPLLSQLMGWGGIALSICSDATIRDNLIAGNGGLTSDPIVGIFLAITENVRIERNRIEQNGQNPALGKVPLPGRRGGIVIGISTGGISEDKDPYRAVDKPALLVNGNTVDALNARALKAITLGPIVVLGNRLSGTLHDHPTSNDSDWQQVLFGLILGSLQTEITLKDYAALERQADIMGGDVVSLIGLGVAEDLMLNARAVHAPQRLRSGEMMVNDNQISLRNHSKQPRSTASSVMLLGGDDISFCNNQAKIESQRIFAGTDVLAMSFSLRITGNRLQKQLSAGALSAITYAVMNQTALNQTTHCIYAVGAGPRGRSIVENQVVHELFHPDPSEDCSEWNQYAVGDSYNLATRLGVVKT
ncbi:DUF6519 domain-containing protein [Nitrosospira sp. Nsp13]|uniref:DUF6519 domain-containing protein n=1 Tax=Nitrosospira sp. Nsp13 TaxID=1855332 RepID=UPI00087F867B|nr:DUF6519 domain-containing protein [Nitrosospira sp. Nsp13]SCX79794.1 Right handed beta helix region [Nitrosospira sp. Nsp13]